MKDNNNKPVGLFLGEEDDFQQNSLTEFIDETPLKEPDELIDPNATGEEAPVIEGVDIDPKADTEGDAGDEAVEFETSLKGNPIAIIAQDWKEQGRLPDDFEIKDDLTPEQFEEEYRNYLNKTTKEELKTEALKELKEEYGLDDGFLETQKTLRSAIDPDSVRTMDLYFRLASVELDSEDPNYKEYAKDLFRYYYTDKEFEEEDVERYADRDLQDGEAASNLDNMIERVQLYFSNKGKSKRDEIAHREEEIKEARKAKVEKFASDVRSKLDSGLINNKQYTPEQMEMVKRAFFDKTEVIVNENGQRERVTPFEKKSREYKTNFDLYMEHLVTFVLGSDASPKSQNQAAQVRKTLRNLNNIVDITIKDKKRVSSISNDTGIVSEEII